MRELRCLLGCWRVLDGWPIRCREGHSELYEANENSTFDCEDGTELTCERQQDGGFAWLKDGELLTTVTNNEEMSPKWREYFDDDDNSVWEALSPYHDGGSPIYWRFKQRLCDNWIEWYEAYDSELMSTDGPDFWVSLDTAKAMIAAAHRRIIRQIVDEDDTASED